MSNDRPITIVGGGLAGLTLGLALRREEIPVQVVEAGNYPRSRVCGEFISGRGLQALESIGLLGPLKHRAIAVNEASFFSETWSIGPWPLPREGLAISRWKLDEWLAREFQKAGGELQVGKRWAEGFNQPGVVRATGRRLEGIPSGNIFGLKIHARKVHLSAALEMHFHPRGYVGLCRVDNETTNVCGLFQLDYRPKNLRELWWEWMQTDHGGALARSLSEAEPDPETFCAVAGLPLEPTWSRSAGEVRVGDAMNMMPPLTGNGMSLAFESALLAFKPLVRYARGGRSWANCLEESDRVNRRAFAGRLRRASWLQRMILTPSGPGLLVRTGRAFPRLVSIFFALTR